jgi:hypothetical protein
MAAVALVVMLAGSPRATAAISCDQVDNVMKPCLPFALGGAGPSAECCSGVKAVQNQVHSTADRQAACVCFKAAAAGISGLNLANAAAIPSKCGITVPYTISPTMDCSKYVPPLFIRRREINSHNLMNIQIFSCMIDICGCRLK